MRNIVFIALMVSQDVGGKTEISPLVANIWQICSLNVAQKRELSAKHALLSLFCWIFAQFTLHLV